MMTPEEIKECVRKECADADLSPQEFIDWCHAFYDETIQFGIPKEVIEWALAQEVEK